MYLFRIIVGIILLYFMEIKGKLQIILPLTEGQGKNGTWKKQEFVIETFDQYPKKICLHVWGDKVDEFKRYKVGEVLTCSIDINSREWNGRWFTDLRAWRIQAGDVQNTSSSNNNDHSFPNQEPGVISDSGINTSNNNWEGDLPF